MPNRATPLTNALPGSIKNGARTYSRGLQKSRVPALHTYTAALASRVDSEVDRPEHYYFFTFVFNVVVVACGKQEILLSLLETELAVVVRYALSMAFLEERYGFALSCCHWPMSNSMAIRPTARQLLLSKCPL